MNFEQFFSGNKILFFAFLLWSMVWKGLSLWRAAKNSHKIWFVALLVLNTMGLLEIVYYFYFSKKINKGKSA